MLLRNDDELGCLLRNGGVSAPIVSGSPSHYVEVIVVPGYNQMHPLSCEMPIT